MKQMKSSGESHNTFPIPSSIRHIRPNRVRLMAQGLKKKKKEGAARGIEASFEKNKDIRPGE